MPTEIEAKFLNINPEAIRQRLRGINAELKEPMRIMRREHFDFSDDRYKNAKSSGTDERLRVRDEGNKVTVTYKKSMPGSQYDSEVEVTVDSYEAAKKLLLAMGLHSFNYQETKRETWQLGVTEIVIDEWPWIRPYLEIEGPSESAIKEVSYLLGLDWSEAKYGSVDTVYSNQYSKWQPGDSIGFVPVVKFDLPLPEYLEQKL